MATANVREQYVVDEKGVRRAVLLDIDDWNRVVTELAEYRQQLGQEPDLAPLLQRSFAFWDNEEDAIYDVL